MMSKPKRTSTTSMNKRVPEDLVHGQSHRLTSRHIQALMQLDDVTVENEQLKSRIDFLEVFRFFCFILFET